MGDGIFVLFWMALMPMPTLMLLLMRCELLWVENLMRGCDGSKCIVLVRVGIAAVTEGKKDVLAWYFLAQVLQVSFQNIHGYYYNRLYGRDK